MLDLALDKLPVIKELGFIVATDKLVAKYQAKKIKSVIHFRRVMESYELNEDDPAVVAVVLRTIQEFFLNPKLETRDGFDRFIADKKRFQGALELCSDFIDKLRGLKLRHIPDDAERTDLRAALKQVQLYCSSLEEALRGSDDPDVTAADAPED